MRCEKIIKNETGYTLPTVLVILSLIFVTIGVIMMLMTTQNRFLQKDIHEVKARYFAEAGIYTFLSNPEFYMDSTRSTFDVFIPDSILVDVERYNYGGFWLIKSTAKSSNEKKSLRVLIGARPDSLYDNVIVMGDINSALILTGTTSVQGDVVSGSDGIQQRSFRGEPFTGDFRGENFRVDSTNFPLFDNRVMTKVIDSTKNNLEEFPGEVFTINALNFDFENISNRDSTFSFLTNGDLILHSGSKRVLPDETTFFVNGSLEIGENIDVGDYSRFFVRDSLLINGDLTGRHALFIAGEKIQIDGNPTLSAQMISGKEISMSGDSYLTYPSLLYVKTTTEGTSKRGTITLHDRSIVDGFLLLPDVDDLITDDQSMITIGDEAAVRGGIYNTSRTELHGKVSGTVLTNQYYFYSSPTSYMNWLKDAEINVQERPPGFIIPLGFNEHPNFTVLDYAEVE